MLAALSMLAALTTAAPAPPAPDLAGRWAQVQTVAEILDLPMIGEVKTSTRFLMLVDLAPEAGSQGEGRFELTETICKIRHESSSSAVKMTFPDALVRAISGGTRDATLAWNEARSRWDYRQPKAWRAHGVKLKNPARDVLPDSARDKRVFDQDRDGFPGLTVGVGGMVSGAIHVVQRAWNDLRGIVNVSADDPSALSIKGIISWHAEQKVLSATNLFLRSPPPREVDPDRSKSWFSMRKVAGDMDCKTLIAKASSIF